VRFGPALAVIERRRRSPLEHLEALGAGLESAADTDTAIKRLTLGLRRRLSRAGYAGNENVVSWLESLELAMRGPQGRAAVRRLHDLLTARVRDEQRVLLAAQAVEDVWRNCARARRATHRRGFTQSGAGTEAAILEVLVCLLARGHILLEGVPGTAKTLLVRTLSLALDVRFVRIQFTPDLMPADITGSRC